MKKIWLLFVLFTSSVPSSLFGQVSISFLSSLAFKQTGEGGIEKAPLSLGGAISYEFAGDFGARLQIRSEEIWNKLSKNSKGKPMPTASIHFYLSEPEHKFLSGPIAGIYLGIGFPMEKHRAGHSKYPKIGGVFIQLNYKFHTAIETYASLFLRVEGGGVLLGNKPADIDVDVESKDAESSGGPNVSAHGNISLGIRLALKRSLKKRFQ